MWLWLRRRLAGARCTHRARQHPGPSPCRGLAPEQPPPPEPALVRIPTFHEYASAWLQGKIDGTLGDKPLAPSTAQGYSGLLRCYLLPFFARRRLDEIDRKPCLAFKAKLYASQLSYAKRLRREPTSAISAAGGEHRLAHVICAWRSACSQRSSKKHSKTS